MIAETLRQWLYPKEFRISTPPPDEPEVWKELAASLRSAALRPDTEPQTVRPVDATPLAQLGTHLWRLRSKLMDTSSSMPREEYRRAYRHMEAAWEALAETGLEVVDPAGQPFDPGQQLKALAFQPVAGLTRDTVIQTMKPTILLRGTLMQQAEVIVGIPEEHGSGER